MSALLHRWMHHQFPAANTSVLEQLFVGSCDQIIQLVKEAEQF